ncbi:MAG: ThiF family adenylyltransferase [Acidimicrobiia bacterium]
MRRSETPAHDANLDEYEVVLDVRPNQSGATIPGSVHAPLAELLESPSAFITSEDTTVLTVCDVGMRSLVAARELESKGFTSVVSLEGGIDRWRRDGKPLTTPIGFSLDDLDRYDRQIKLPDVGAAGQRTILDATVTVIGAGGLGAPVISYLAGAGVGRLRIIDGDVVEVSNLQRQPLYTPEQASESKSQMAAMFAAGLNPTIQVDHIDEMLTATNARKLIEGSDAVVDATDRFDARYAINDAAIDLGVPLVSGAVYRWEGQLMTVMPEGPCYRCVFPSPPDSDVTLDCALTGVIGPVVGTIGSMQATEVLRLLVGADGGFAGRLVLVDGRTASTTSLMVERRDGCPACGN